MSEDQKINISQKIASKIKGGDIKMKPGWYFTLGSLAMMAGLVGLVILSVFLVSLITFSLRSHGPMGAVRYDQLVASFPWWALFPAFFGIFFGTRMLKRYDFSYKKNFLAIAIFFVAAIILAGVIIDYTGLDNLWINRGPMKGFYQRYDGGMRRGGPLRWMMQNNELRY